MRIYFSGIGGVGIGPLALIAADAGYDIIGSDLERSRITHELQQRGYTVDIGTQDGSVLRDQHAIRPFDYFVHTAALQDNHPELRVARELGIPQLKRDGLLARIIDENNLTMIACAGTHGKTSTTGLVVWILKQLGIPASYSIGSTISYGPSGTYIPGSKYFVYECDEYDRNFLHFTPEVSIITAIDYDHPDTYPTLEQYQAAFAAFIDQSDITHIWKKDFKSLGSFDTSSEVVVYDDVQLNHLHLAGQHMRQNAFLAERAILRLFPDTPYHGLVAAINSFPGTDRRVEKLADNLYSDYGHHPAEISATLQMASELNDRVVLVYQPHQNVRQHEICDEYTDEIFANTDAIFWLPTYLSREDDDKKILTPQELASKVTRTPIEFHELDDRLWQAISKARSSGSLVLCMGAGNIDSWLREKLNAY